MDQFDYSELCSKLATRTAGMSGRALSKLGVAWQAAAYASDDGRLTQQMCIDICDDAVRDHRQKVCTLHKFAFDGHKAIKVLPVKLVVGFIQYLLISFFFRWNGCQTKRSLEA